MWEGNLITGEEKKEGRGGKEREGRSLAFQKVKGTKQEEPSPRRVTGWAQPKWKAQIR